MKRILLYLLIMAGLSSCRSYYISVDSFKEQLARYGPNDMVAVHTEGPMGDVVSYKTFPLKYIECTDKKGNPVRLPFKPSIEIRFTDTNNRRTIFYFDLMRVDQTIVRGSTSRFITNLNRTLFLDAIKKIEVQDGRKRFTYVDVPSKSIFDKK